MKPTLVFASNNQHKILEVQSLLNSHYDVTGLEQAGIDIEIEETGTTLLQNSQIKARTIHQKFKVDCFADDTGLLIEALNNEPGVYSARYAGPQRSAQDNMNLVLQKLQQHNNRKAKFVTVITLILAGIEHIFQGEVYGHIQQSPSGTDGFGYDPIFVPALYNISFAEMSKEQKNKISHRGKAITKLANFLRNQ